MADRADERAAMAARFRERGIADERVLAAVRSVPRHAFVPEPHRSGAYDEVPWTIGDGQTISAPWIVAFSAESLRLPDEARVLEIGTGSGYGAAVLAAAGASVVTIERHPGLAGSAREALQNAGYGDVDVRVGDGHAGVPDRAPYEGIVVTAMAQDELPPALVEQLAPGASLVCPVGRGGHGTLFRYCDGVVEKLLDVRFVPLVAG
ncbi:protein-L-isoaspartate(D-aspartate) O-methyltransferase [Pseudonocardia endophytica]|uniref:Protein-L-isoaspartate O-methyltransferase n=1 Tax=Pseudonocardia endophytica TaxID=401976 RepID=A0A4R1HNV0_PSEEN|nr:protein-L-isoaspartate(D-aspartate) O-methyltransferase [Pseudonocardia endophytica]TCK21379.1 protein-L-isoaspartate(D-aspartate) O-methyltransferase [Pseudonocardia endophytica]